MILTTLQKGTLRSIATHCDLAANVKGDLPTDRVQDLRNARDHLIAIVGPPSPTPVPVPPGPTPAPPSPAPTPSPSPSPPGPIPPADPPVPGNWQLKFSDDFADLSNWWPTWPPASTPQVPMSATEVACYDPACVTTGAGGLVIAAVAKTQTVGGVTYDYATGVIATRDTSLFVPGDYVEFEAQFPTSADGYLQNHCGVWSTAQDWPAHGECDIAETWAGEMGCNYHDPSGAQGQVILGDWSGVHRYGALYGPSSVTYFYDGVQVATLSDDSVNSPQYLLVSMQLGDSPAPVTVGAQLRVLSVRVFSPA